MLREFRALGVAEAEIAAFADALARRAAADEGVWPQNEAIVAAFLAIETQWRFVPIVAPHGVIMHASGLDYAGARAGLEARGITITPALWDGIRVMERAAIAAINEVRR